RSPAVLTFPRAPRRSRAADAFHPSSRACRAGRFGRVPARRAPMKTRRLSMTIEFDFEVLSSLGLTAALASRALQHAADAPPDARLMRVVEVHRETLVLHDGHDLQR